VVEQSSGISMIEWRATTGPFGKKELISEFQSALSEEIAAIKKQNGGKKTPIYDGQRIYSSKVLHIYRFQNDDPAIWRIRRAHTELALNIDNELIFGSLESSDQGGINIAIETDKGDYIEEATVLDLSFELHENLTAKFERVKSEEVEFNFDGSMKLFGFQKPNNFVTPIPYAEQKTTGFSPNTEQQIAILKSMSQEVTFIWGPPGTGKTKTLGSILNALIAARRSVLLTANTNTAVDEILKKFIENQENASFIEEGKIVRLGIPTIEDESFNEVLLDKIVERKTLEIKKRVEEIQAQIDAIQETLRKYERTEQTVLEKKALRDTQVLEYLKVDEDIQSLQKRTETAKTNTEQATNLLSNKLQLLEKARTASTIKRAFAGLNKDQIEAEVKSVENRFRISQLELQSLQKELNEYIQKRDSISTRIKEFDNEIELNLDEITTLDSLRQKILELKEESENKRNAITSLQTQVQKIKEIVLNDALVIGTTIARASLDPKISKRKFEVFIIDEASMAALPNVFFLAGLCSSHYIISGDFRQLSPIAISNTNIARKWLKRDIFTQAGIVDSVDSNVHDDRLVMLREQYRMHPSICSLISEAVYGGKLTTPQNIVASKEKLAGLPPFEGNALIFCDTATINPYITRPKNSFSRISPYSAAVSSNLALKYVEDGEKNGFKVNVGIITPYRAQAKLISKIIDDKNEGRTNIVASTIHSFQGSERDCIIFDLVEGEPLDPGKLTQGSFKNSEQGKLITVAISRAIGKFILVGNSKYIKYKFWATDAITQIVENIEQNGKTAESNIILNWSSDETYKKSEIPLKGVEISDSTFTLFDQTNFYDVFSNDLKKAKSRIVILSPFILKKSVETLLDAFESILQKNVPIYVVTRKSEFLKENKTEVAETLEELKRIGVKVIELTSDAEKDEKFHHKIAVIDNAVFYYGSLNILAHSKSSDSMMAFRSKKTVAQLVRVFGVNKIIKDHENIKNTNSRLSIIQIAGEEILKNNSAEGNCPICKRRLELNHCNDGFYFACSNKAHEKHCTIEIDNVKKAVASLKIKCAKCSSGQMILQYAKDSNPFLGCTQYRKSNCQSKLQLRDTCY
jgi:superfamily I DNA and/or RNA helicase